MSNRATDDELLVTVEEADDEVIVAPEEGDADEIRVIKGYRKRTAEIRFGGDYKGLWVKVWINCPWRLFKRLSSADSDTVDRALAEFIDSHNLRYEGGDPLPTPLTLRAVGDLDTLLRVRIVTLGGEAVQKAAGVNPS